MLSRKQIWRLTKIVNYLEKHREDEENSISIPIKKWCIIKPIPIKKKVTIQEKNNEIFWFDLDPYSTYP